VKETRVLPSSKSSLIQGEVVYEECFRPLTASLQRRKWSPWLLGADNETISSYDSHFLVTGVWLNLIGLSTSIGGHKFSRSLVNLWDVGWSTSFTHRISQLCACGFCQCCVEGQGFQVAPVSKCKPGTHVASAVSTQKWILMLSLGHARCPAFSTFQLFFQS
jgi:hypothetical protein